MTGGCPLIYLGLALALAPSVSYMSFVSVFIPRAATGGFPPPVACHDRRPSLDLVRSWSSTLQRLGAFHHRWKATTGGSRLIWLGLGQCAVSSLRACALSGCGLSLAIRPPLLRLLFLVSIVCLCRCPLGFSAPRWLWLVRCDLPSVSCGTCPWSPL